MSTCARIQATQWDMEAQDCCLRFHYAHSSFSIHALHNIHSPNMSNLHQANRTDRMEPIDSLLPSSVPITSCHTVYTHMYEGNVQNRLC